MRLRSAALFISPLLYLSATCSSPSDEDGDDDRIHVAGTYDTGVELGTNSCGAVTVQPNNTTVAHQPGATALSLTHATITYQGTLEADGSFETEPRVITGSGETYTITIAGQFTLTGFDAQVDVGVQRAAGPCSYVVAWTATRQGGTNTLP